MALNVRVGRFTVNYSLVVNYDWCRCGRGKAGGKLLTINCQLSPGPFNAKEARKLKVFGSIDTIAAIHITLASTNVSPPD